MRQWKTRASQYQKSLSAKTAAVRFNAGKDTYLFTLLQSDLNELAGETLDTASKNALEQIELARKAQDQQQEPGTILNGFGITAIATLILVVG